MADSTSNSLSTPTIRITPAADTCVRESMEEKNGIASKEETIISNVETSNSFSCRDKGKDQVLRPSTFLRPSALAGGAFKVNSVVNATATLPKLNASGNKFACPESSTDSIFSAPTNSEKKEVKPALTTPVSIPAPIPLSNPDFVFGQNLLARVVERPEAVGNGSNNIHSAGDESSTDSTGKAESKSSLLEDAARCQEQRAQKRKYEEVLVTTGEEDEKNVAQFTVKLFAFEGGSWLERGRGNLRLNDGGNGSRIVVRTMGSLRVVLNTKIWADMELSRASEKSIRLTAMDAAGQLKIYLIQAAPTDITALYTTLETRVHNCQLDERARKRSSLDQEKLGNSIVAKDENSPSSAKEPALKAAS